MKNYKTFEGSRPPKVYAAYAPQGLDNEGLVCDNLACQSGGGQTK